MTVESQAADGGRRRDRRRGGRVRVLRADRSTRPVGDDSVDELRAELVLLREENASLKAAAHGRSDVGALMHSARTLSLAVATPTATAQDEASDAVVEMLVLREALLETCREFSGAVSAIEQRLQAFAPHDAAPKPSRRLMAAADGAASADAVASRTSG